VSQNALAVVTGAGSGIGAAFATELARRSGRVVCSDVNEVAAAKTVSTITDKGGEAVAIACDVSRFDDVQELAAQSESWLGAAPTLVINNAGVGSGGAPIGELPLDDWQWVLGINLWGPIHGCHVFAPILRSAEPSNRPRGIINVASAAAFGAAALFLAPAQPLPAAAQSAPPSAQLRTLANGMRVVVLEDHAAPVVQVWGRSAAWLGEAWFAVTLLAAASHAVTPPPTARPSRSCATASTSS